MIITIGRKPFEGSVSENVEKNLCGAINVDATRVGTEERYNPSASTRLTINYNYSRGEEAGRSCTGRWGANFLVSENMVTELDTQSGLLKSGRAMATSRGWGAGGDVTIFSWTSYDSEGYDDEGGASRFFYKVQE